MIFPYSIILLGCLYVNKIMYRLIHTIANGENNGMLPDNNHYLMLYSDINAFCSFFSCLWLIDCFSSLWL